MADPVPTVDEITDSIAQDVNLGVQEVIVDGTTTRASDPMRRLDVAERIERRAAANSRTAGLRFKRLIPPGCG